MHGNWRGEKEKTIFKEVVEQQIQEKTREEVVKVIQEKQNLVRDTVEKKKCLIIYGLKERKNNVKTEREKELKESVKKVMEAVNDGEQNLEGEIEEMFRLCRYREEGVRQIKVRMRSQAVVEDIMTKTGRLGSCAEFKKVWIKRVMNSEERAKEKELREEAKGKKSRKEQRKR